MSAADAYATALARSIAAGTAPEKACVSLVALLQREGKKGLLPRIKRAYSRIAYKAAQTEATLTVASKDDIDAAKKAVARMQPNTRTIVDDRIIGGFVYRTADTQIDTSYKSALLSMYRSIIRS